MTCAFLFLLLIVILLLIPGRKTSVITVTMARTTKKLRAVAAALMTSAIGLNALAAGTPEFETANRLYFEGKFAEAAAAYEQLLSSSPGSAALHFNLGNACFKADQKGRAIAAYLRAQQLAPRDPALRFNLKFVREKVTGSDQPVGRAWQRALAALTLNEWTGLTAGAFWVLFLLLALRELRSAFRPALRSYALLAGVMTVLLAGCLVAAYGQTRSTTAVVVVPEAVVRHGPLERSPVAFQLRDGSEVLVQDQQEIADQNQKQSWLQVQDAARRVGWLKREQVIVLSSPASASKDQTTVTFR